MKERKRGKGSGKGRVGVWGACGQGGKGTLIFVFLALRTDLSYAVTELYL